MIAVEYTGGMEILHSGSIHVYGERGSASIVIDSTLTLDLKFETKGGVPAGRINFNGENSSRMILTFYNFFGAQREGPSEPIKIGTYESKDLFISLFVFTYKMKYRIINYSFLSKNE